MFFINTLVFVVFGAMITFLIGDSSFFPYFLLSLVFVGATGWVNFQLFHFKELNFFKLKKAMRKIVEKHPDAGIKNISLYEYDSPNREHFGKIPTRYLVVIKLGDCLSEAAKELSDIVRNFHNYTFDDLIIPRLGLPENFDSVYKNTPPPKDFYKEWNFITITACTDTKEKGISKHHWILYKRFHT